MLPCLRRYVSRTLLFVMCATFLSPGFAWHLVATDEQLAHTLASTALDHGDELAASMHDHDDGLGGSLHDHEDAHTLMGHLLSHLPMILNQSFASVPPSAAAPHPAFVGTSVLYVASEPPFRPPRS